MTDLHIRNARPDDLPACCELLRLLFDIEEDFSFDADKALAGLRLLVEPADDHIIFVAERDDTVVGMVTLQCLVSTAEGGSAAILEDLVVARENQGQGIATQLLAEAERWCAERKITRIQLLTDQDNTRALAFYRHVGWQRTQLIALRRSFD